MLLSLSDQDPYDIDEEEDQSPVTTSSVRSQKKSPAPSAAVRKEISKDRLALLTSSISKLFTESEFSQTISL